MKIINEHRSEKLRQQNFSLDQLDLLASKLGQSVEMLQMMIDGVAEIPDKDARLIEQLLEKPHGYLDGDQTLDPGKNSSPIDSSGFAHASEDLDLDETQIQIVRKFLALSKKRQKVVIDMIDALTDMDVK